MRNVSGVVLGCVLLIGTNTLAKDRAISASLVQLIGNPEKFDKKVVDVTAFLVIEHQPRHAPLTLLTSSQEDAGDLIRNGFLLIPSKQMLRDEEKINNTYVHLRGTFHATPTVGRKFVLEINDVQSYVPSPNPDRPIGGRE